MQVLLPIREAAKPGAPSRPSWRAFTEMGFRPLYLLGCAWALVSVLLWIHAPGWLRGDMGGVFWHGHEMLWAFVGTIAVGFLLTAGGNWTGHNPLRGNALAALCALWLVARVAYLVPGRPAFWIATIADLVFFLWAAAALGRSVWRSRNKRNYGVPVMLLALALTHLMYAIGVVRGDYLGLMRGLNAGLLSMAVLTLLIARRIIPFFAGRAVAGLTIPPHTRSGHLQIAAGVIAIAMLLAGLNTLAALALAASGVIALVQWLAWKPWAVRRVPLLWILYAGYLGLGIGLLVGAAHLAGAVAWGAWHVHTIGVAGFSVLIIGMVTRTALGHLGRPLRTDKSMVLSYLLILMAALLRLAALWPQAPVVPLLHASATAWALALGLYLWRFAPMMIRPRF
ncbi:NnrS family protein [Pseudomonadota bacterium AL_CKDN230030165-1A_HGKHYDSX7]